MFSARSVGFMSVCRASRVHQGLLVRPGAAALVPRSVSAAATSNGAPQSKAGSREHSNKWYRHPTFVAACTLFSTVAGAWLTGIVGPGRAAAAEEARNMKLAEAAVSFTARRVAAIKETLKRSGTRAAQKPANKVGKGPLPLIKRPYAMSVLEPIVRQAGLYMVCGPTGEGKSSLVEQLAQENRFVICVDLGNVSVDQSVRAVASAIGYSLQYTLDERAAKAAGFGVPIIREKQSFAEFEQMLLAFERACDELREEGALEGCVPVLILDHSDRPKPGPSDDDPNGSLIYTMMEIRHRIANKSKASWVAVISDPQQEQEAWTKAGGRDSLQAIRVPPFSMDEARQLLARAIFAETAPRTAAPVTPSATAAPAPTAEQLAEIESRYASTLNFACSAVGTRPRWLLQMLPGPPLSDAELASTGVAVDPAFEAYLPNEMRDLGPALRVDPKVWSKFTSLVTKRNTALKPLLEVAHDFALPPRQPPPFTEEDLIAKRVLAVDAALRDLLLAVPAGGMRAPEETPTASMPTAPKGVPVGITFEALRNKHFAMHEPDLHELCAKHVLFLNHGSRTVEFESDLMRRIVDVQLKNQRHMVRMELLRKLQEWQAAADAETEPKRQFKLRKGMGTDSKSRNALTAAETEWTDASKAVKKLKGDIEILRRKLNLSSKSATQEPALITEYGERLAVLEAAGAWGDAAELAAKARDGEALQRLAGRPGLPPAAAEIVERALAGL